jgi:hypothetical protein
MVGGRVKRSDVTVEGRAALDKPPLVLLDPLLLSGNVWRDVRAHLVGSSRPGRGRAASVCALSPAGFWSIGDGPFTRATTKVRSIAAVSRISRPGDVHEVHGAHQVGPLDPLPCPITLAWSEKDSLTRPRRPEGLRVNASTGDVHDPARCRHRPTNDDPELVARTILQATAAAHWS